MTRAISTEDWLALGLRADKYHDFWNYINDIWVDDYDPGSIHTRQVKTSSLDPFSWVLTDETEIPLGYYRSYDEAIVAATRLCLYFQQEQNS